MTVLTTAEQALHNASDAASALFYLFGALGILLGAAIAWRRFQLQSPLSPAWRVDIDDASVRRVGSRDGGTCIYTVNLTVTNESQSRQRLEKLHVRLELGGSNEFVEPFAEEQAKYPETFFRDSRAIQSDVKPGGRMAFGKSHGEPLVAHAVAVFYVFEFSSPGWFGYRNAKRGQINYGRTTVNVRLGDLAFYGEGGAPKLAPDPRAGH